MGTAIENRLRKLEAQCKEAKPLFVVVSDHAEAERRIAEFGPNPPEDLMVLITGVPSPEEDDK